MKSSEQFAIEWNRSKRAINDLCNKGKIPGAIKEGRKWLIPDDAVRPVDKRVSSGKYAKKKAANNKSLPIGISDYVRAQADYYYVDKTLLIKEFLDQKPLVSLFTRLRRFGKTLNMDMLRVFFVKEVLQSNFLITQRSPRTPVTFEDFFFYFCIQNLFNFGQADFPGPLRYLLITE